jgi:hypothetical protein
VVDNVLARRVAERVMAEETVSFVEYVSETIPEFDLDKTEILREVLRDATYDHHWKDAYLLKESLDD